MKQFLKFFTASCLGTFLALFALFVVVLIAGAALLAYSFEKESAKQPERNSVLRLNLVGQLEERRSEDYYAMLFDETSLPTIGLNEVLQAVRNAADDEKVNGIYVNCGVFSSGMSSARAIRQALLDFKKSGKFVVAYGGMYTQTTYYIASAADKVILNPVGMVDWRGLSSSLFFYKNLLDKVGVEVELVKVGKFKSFAEKYTNTTISPENEYQTEQYLNSIWHTMCEDVSLSRSASVKDLEVLADSAATFLRADTLRRCGLVDTLLYEKEALDWLAEMNGVDKVADLKFVSVSQMQGQAQGDSPKIAVVYAVGSIDDGVSASTEGINSEKMSRLLDKIAENDEVKGVVLRINSPGGSAYGAEQIWKSVERLRMKKPVVVSMGDYAASGGYYIACAADRIIADPTTITGSIGIFGVIPNFAGLMDKVGVSQVTIKTNDKSDMVSGMRSFTPAERALMQSYVEEGYRLFVKRCADGRYMSVQEIEEIAEGRVWTGEMAKKIGLVDELGGLQDAVKVVADRCMLTDYQICEYPEQDDMMTRFMRTLEGDVRTSLLKKSMGDNYVHYKAVEDLKSMQGVQALLPVNVIIR